MAVVGLLIEGVKDRFTIKTALPEAVESGELKLYELGGTIFGTKLAAVVEKALSECDVVYSLVDPDSAGDKVNLELHRKHHRVKMFEVDPERCAIDKMRKGRIRKKYGLEYASASYIQDIYSIMLSRLPKTKAQ